MLDVVAFTLRREGFEVDEQTDGAAGLEAARARSYDIVILDVMLPGLSGTDVCRALRAESDVPILMLTARDAEIDRVLGLELGADDYVVKPFATGEVISRMRAVLRRARPVTTEARELAVRDLRLDLAARRAWIAERELELTRKEFDLLARLARDAGRVVTREELMSDVWDMNWFGSTKTLDVHIAWLRRKLGDDPAAPGYIQTVRGVGFRFAAPDEGSSP